MDIPSTQTFQRQFAVVMAKFAKPNIFGYGRTHFRGFRSIAPVVSRCPRSLFENVSMR